MEDRAAELRAHAIGLESLYDINEDIHGAQQALISLKDKRQTILVRLHKQGLSFRELARACGVGKNTMQRWLGDEIPNYYSKNEDGQPLNQTEDTDNG